MNKVRIKEKGYIKDIIVCVAILCFLAIFIVGIQYIKSASDIYTNWICAITVSVVIMIMAFFLPSLKKNGITERTVFYIFFLGIVIRLFYVIVAPAHLYQNDVGRLEENNFGHLGYIYYIFANNELPDYTPHLYGQYYHPPFYHIVTSCILKIIMAFGVDIADADEVLQFASVVYSGIIMLYLDKISKLMKMTLNGRFIVASLVAFLPYNVMMSGALNNDLMMYMLSIMGLYYILHWYKGFEYKDIIIAAFCIGFAMMTKISAVLLAPGMVIVIIWKCWQERAKIIQGLGQAILFLLISVPLGVWVPLYNHIKYETPFDFVPRLSDESRQYIGQYSVWERLFDFNGAFDTIILSWSKSEEYMDHNIWISLIKYAVTGEGYNIDSNPVINIVAHISFYLTLILFVLLVIVVFLFVCSRKNDLHIKIMYAVSIVLIMGSYIKFCFSHPHICTMNIRYIMSVFFMMVLAMGGFISSLCSKETNRSKWIGSLIKGIHIYCFIYMITTVLLFINLAFL